MKYFWIGMTTLAVILCGCLVSAHYLRDTVDQASALLDQAEQAADRGDYEAAGDQVTACLDLWERAKGGCGTLLRHDDTDEVYYSLCQLRAYARLGSDDFFVQLAEARGRLKNLWETELLHYYNFL